MHDTIFALATAPGRAGVAVMRLSGPAAGAALAQLAGTARFPPRRAVLARFRNPVSGELLDEGLALWFPGPSSFTGEDVAELHLHGSRAVVAEVAETLAALPGLRPAEAGEFTRRAFDNGRLDLTAVEGLADLIAAETAAQRRMALRQLGGELGALYDRWRERLVRALAHCEAAIDFPEDDLPDELVASVSPIVGEVAAEIAAHLDDDRRGEMLREGCQVAVLGAPNVGKSSLVNAIARRDVAIVSDTAGTTRDVIEVRLDLGGYPVTIADTAGLRATADAVEREGVRRALARADTADIRLLVADATLWPDLDSETAAQLHVEGEFLLVLNKIDCARAPWTGRFGDIPVWGVSARTGMGISAVLRELETRVSRRLDVGGPPALTRLRHRGALAACVAALDRATTAPLPELIAEDLRMAVGALGRITGRVDVEDLLDVIFRDFCIGK